MEKINTSFAHKVLKILKWAFLVLVGLFVLLEIIRFPFRVQEEKTAAEVIKIHNTKLTIDDVMGKDLPPDPGAEADKTIAGIDANNNGIRDDVEIAIFKAYPDSAKTRAVLLQYALVLQMEMTQPILNEDTATAIAEEDSRAYDCIGKIVPMSNDDLKKIASLRNFIEIKVFNTNLRENKRKNYNDNVRSFALQSGCDVDFNLLLN